MKKWLSIGIVVVATLAFAGCEEGVDQVETDTSVAIEVAQVQVDDIPVSYQSVGRVQQSEVVTLTPQVNGIVDKVLVEPGQEIEKDTPLATIRKSGDLDQLRLQKKQADNSLLAAKLNASDMEKRLGDLKALLASGAVAKEDLRAVEIQYTQAKLQVENADKAARVAGDALERLDDHYAMESPVAGVVESVAGLVGDTSGKLLVTIAKPNGYKIDIGIPDRLIQEVDLGEAARLSFDTQDISTQGMVSKIARTVDPVTGTYRVTLDVDKVDHLRSGLFAKVVLDLKVLADQKLVPASAVLFEGKQAYVMTLVDGKPKRVNIVTGQYVESSVQVIEGLSETDTIIVKGHSLVNENTLVKVVN